MIETTKMIDEKILARAELLRAIIFMYRKGLNCCKFIYPVKSKKIFSSLSKNWN